MQKHSYVPFVVHSNVNDIVCTRFALSWVLSMDLVLVKRSMLCYANEVPELACASSCIAVTDAADSFRVCSIRPATPSMSKSPSLERRGYIVPASSTSHTPPKCV